MIYKYQTHQDCMQKQRPQNHIKTNMNTACFRSESPSIQILTFFGLLDADSINNKSAIGPMETSLPYLLTHTLNIFDH